MLPYYSSSRSERAVYRLLQYAVPFRSAPFSLPLLPAATGGGGAPNQWFYPPAANHSIFQFLTSTLHNTHLFEVEEGGVVPPGEHDEVVQDARLLVEGLGRVELEEGVQREPRRLALLSPKKAGGWTTKQSKNRGHHTDAPRTETRQTRQTNQRR